MKRHRNWLDHATLSRLPSDHFRANVSVTFQDDWAAFPDDAPRESRALALGQRPPALRLDVPELATRPRGADRPSLRLRARRHRVAHSRARLYGLDVALAIPPPSEPLISVTPRSRCATRCFRRAERSFAGHGVVGAELPALGLHPVVHGAVVVDVPPGGRPAVGVVDLGVIDLEVTARVASSITHSLPPTIIAVRKSAGMWRPKCATVVMSRPFLMICGDERVAEHLAHPLQR